jgi:hypothetical protein
MSDKVLIGKVVAHTGLEPVISALRGQRVNQLHQCAAVVPDYRWGTSERQVCVADPSGQYRHAVASGELYVTCSS